MKERSHTPEKELNKMETSNLLDAVQFTGYKDFKKLSEDLNRIKITQ